MSIIPHGPVRSILALVLGLAFGVGGFMLFSQWEGSVDFNTDRDMPALELQLLNGGSRSLESLTEHNPAVVVVFASWCRYCKPVMRSLKAFQNHAAPEGIGVYAVNYGEEPEVVERTVAAMGLDMPVFVDEDNTFAQAMGLDGIPVVFGVAPGGVIRYTDYALPPESEWRSFIESLQ